MLLSLSAVPWRCARSKGRGDGVENSLCSRDSRNSTAGCPSTQPAALLPPRGNLMGTGAVLPLPWGKPTVKCPLAQPWLCSPSRESSASQCFRSLLPRVSVLYPCYSPHSLGHEKPSDGVQIHQVLILCYFFSILIDNRKLQWVLQHIAKIAHMHYNGTQLGTSLV